MKANLIIICHILLIRVKKLYYVLDQTTEQKIVKKNTLMFVALHELARVISVTMDITTNLQLTLNSY